MPKSQKTITLYGIPNCDTVKKARTWLDGRGVTYRFHDFRAEGLDRKWLEAWVSVGLGVVDRWPSGASVSLSFRSNEPAAGWSAM